MGKQTNKYFFPIPEGCLYKRFKPAFTKLVQNQSATVVALPFAGKTSHLRFITSQPQILTKLGVNHNKTSVCFLDIEKVTNKFESFLCEILTILSKQQSKVIKQVFLSQDEYLLSREIYNQIEKITKKRSITLILSLNEKVIPYISQIDNLIVQIQKSVSKYPVNVLWSIDTQIIRCYREGHGSSTFFDNICYFPFFSKSETLHSLDRLSLVKDRKISPKIKSKIMEITGGIAGFFHPLVNCNHLLQLDEIENNLYSLATSQVIFELLNKEFELVNQKLLDKLITPYAKKLITAHTVFPTIFQSIEFFKGPSAQEINLVRLMRDKSGNPVSRDEIAQTLWGKAWQSKYSDWAIDKTIQRLRRNIKSKEWRVLTVKNFGYQLMKI
jgi:hypothetical protein